MGLASYALNFLVIYLVIYKSTKAMREYSIILLLSAFVDTVFNSANILTMQVDNWDWVDVVQISLARRYSSWEAVLHKQRHIGKSSPAICSDCLHLLDVWTLFDRSQRGNAVPVQASKAFLTSNITWSLDTTSFVKGSSLI